MKIPGNISRLASRFFAILAFSCGLYWLYFDHVRRTGAHFVTASSDRPYAVTIKGLKVFLNHVDYLQAQALPYVFFTSILLFWLLSRLGKGRNEE